MADARQKLRLSLVEPYYPLAYQDKVTKNLKGSSVTFFDFLQIYLRDISYEYVYFKEYEVANRSFTDPGGALGAIIEGKVLTELSGAGILTNYLQVYDASPPIGNDYFAFYEASCDADTWSRLSYFIPFSPLIFTLSVVSIVIIALLQCRGRNSTLLASILTGISSALFTFGVTFIFFAYGAGFQGNLIVATPAEKIPYDSILREFESGARLWYYHIVGLADFSSLSYIPTYVEADLQKLIGLLCARPGVVTVSMYTEEYIEMQLYDAPSGCHIQKVNLVEPIEPSPTYYNFQSGYYYFLLPKKLPRRLKEAINFVTNAMFQADQRDTHLLYDAVDVRSFPDITPVQPPLADYSPLSLYSIGVIVIIFLSLQVAAIILFAIEIVVHRLKLDARVKSYLARFEKPFLIVHRRSLFRR